MKKFLAVAVLTLAAIPAMGQWQHGHHYHGYRNGGHYSNNWIAPAIIGGFIGYELTRPIVIQQQQPPVIVQNPPIVYQSNQNCTAWIETQNQDGTITRTRTCAQ